MYKLSLISLFQNFSEKQANETAAAPTETNAPHAPPPGTLLVSNNIIVDSYYIICL